MLSPKRLYQAQRGLGQAAAAAGAPIVSAPAQTPGRLDPEPVRLSPAEMAVREMILSSGWTPRKAREHAGALLRRFTAERAADQAAQLLRELGQTAEREFLRELHRESPEVAARVERARAEHLRQEAEQTRAAWAETARRHEAFLAQERRETAAADARAEAFLRGLAL